MGDEHIWPTWNGAGCIKMLTGTAKMEIPVKGRAVKATKAKAQPSKRTVKKRAEAQRRKRR